MQLVTVPSEILNEKCSEIPSALAPEYKDIAEEMIDIMVQSNGIGLAAPQVGIGQRIIVFREVDEARGLGESVVMIDPEITELSGDPVIGIEGCLSVPVIQVPVKRPTHVRVTALDLEGARFDYQADGLVARCIQHEIDHLNGITMLDHLDDDDQPKYIAIPKSVLDIEISEDDDFPFVCLEVNGKDQVMELFKDVFASHPKEIPAQEAITEH